MESTIKRIFALTAILLIVVQSFFSSVAFAVQPWTGNTWSGDTWSGDTWSGDTWEGTPWEGNTWSGDTWSGNGTNGESWQGDGTDGSGTNGNGTSGDGTAGDGTSGNGTNGDGTGGNGTSGNGTSGNGTSGNGTSGDGTGSNGTSGNGTDGSGTNSDGTSGNGTTGDGTSGNGSSGDGSTGNGTSGNAGNDYSKTPTPYEVAKYIGNDVILGQVQLAADSYAPDAVDSMGGNTSSFLRSTLFNGLKLGINSPILDFASDVSDGVDVYQDAKGAISTLTSGTNIATNTTAAGSMMNGAAQAGSSAMGALGKLNVATAAVGTVLGVVDTSMNIGKAFDVFGDDNTTAVERTVAVTDATESLGSTLMSAGGVAAAIPGGQAIGAGLVVAGAAIWGASKLTSYVAKNWDGIKNTASKVSGAISKGWNALFG